MKKCLDCENPAEGKALRCPDCIKNRARISSREWRRALAKKPDAESREVIKAHRASSRRYQKGQIAVNEDYRTKQNHKSKIREIAGGKGGKRLISSIGCSGRDFKKHLEDHFTGKMSWGNRGEYWVLGHIVPLSAFDATDPEDAKLAFNYRNIVPIRQSLLAGKKDESSVWKELRASVGVEEFRRIVKKKIGYE